MNTWKKSTATAGCAINHQYPSCPAASHHFWRASESQAWKEPASTAASRFKTASDSWDQHRAKSHSSCFPFFKIHSCSMILRAISVWDNCRMFHDHSPYQPLEVSKESSQLGMQPDYQDIRKIAFTWQTSCVTWFYPFSHVYPCFFVPIFLGSILGESWSRPRKSR